MNKDKLLELEQWPVGRLLWKYSIPAVVGMLVMQTYNIIDRIFIGQWVGAKAIAGLAVTFPVMNISAALGVLIGVGAASRISIVLGEKNKDVADKILGNSLTMLLSIGITYTIVFALFLEDILRAFGASDATLPYAYDYTVWLLPGFLVMNLCYSFNNMMRASGYPKKAMVTMIIGAILNVILDPIFIYALGWGIKGAAIATDLAMFISMWFVMWHFMKKESMVRFRRGTYKLDGKLVLGIMSIGAAPFLVNVAGCLINVIVNNSLLRYGGDNAVGAIGIFFTYTQLLVMLIVGICQGMQPIVGYNYGAHKYDRLNKAFYITAIVGTAVSTLGWVGSAFFPEYITRMFTNDEELINVTCHGMSLATVMFWMVGFQIVSTNLFQSIGQAGKSILLSLTRQVIFLIPLLYFFPKIWQLDGVWTAFPTSDFLATVVTILLLWWQFSHMKKQVQH